VLGGGVLIELALIVVAVPFFATGRPEVVSTVIVPATLVVAVLCGAWTARGTAAPLLNGTLAGIAAFVVYVTIALVGLLAAPERADMTAVLSPAYLGSHLCKVLGGALGGWWIAYRRQRA
jgi:predicted alpha/beta-hydrolase family hydrolase